MVTTLCVALALFTIIGVSIVGACTAVSISYQNHVEE